MLGARQYNYMSSAIFWLSFYEKGTKDLLKFEYPDTGIAAARQYLEHSALYCLAPSLYHPTLPPSPVSFLLLFSPPSSSSIFSVCFSKPPRLSPQRPPAAAGAGTLSRLASSFIFCSSSHAMATKASTFTCSTSHDHITRPVSHAHTCSHVDARSSHVYTGSTRA